MALTDLVSRPGVAPYTDGYELDVPTAALDPRRGQRHRARQAISEAAWRLYDGDLGEGPDPASSTNDGADSWGYSVDRGGAEEAADAALRLLCTIVELPMGVQVSVLPVAQGGRPPAEL